MDLAARKYHFIEELLKVKSEDIMNQLEDILKPSNTISNHNKEILSQRLSDYHNNPDDLLDWEAVKDKW